MAAIYDIAGTSSHSFTIGDNGVTTFYGNIEPSKDLGKVGDIYVQTKTSIEGMSTVATYSNLPTKGQFKGYLITVTTDSTHSNKTTIYEWNGSSWVYVMNADDETQYRKLGRVFIKTIQEGETTWDYVKHYSFDTPIITSAESALESGNFKISLQAGNNTSIATSTKANDYTTNHDAYGVVRFATDTEENSDVDKLIAATPKQIKTRIDTLISTHNSDGNAHSDKELKANKVQSVSSTSTSTQYPSAAAVWGIEDNLQQQIDAIVAKSDVVDIVQCYDRGTDTSKTDIVHYDTSKLGNNDLIKVLTDEQHQNQRSYYRWSTTTKTFTYVGSEGEYYTKSEMDGFLALKAPLASPALTGTPTAPTAATGTNTTQIATTAFVKTAVDNGKVWGQITGTLSNQTDLQNALNLKAPLASPALTGTPTAPTATKGTSTTQIATTAFVATGLADKLNASDLPTLSSSNKNQVLYNEEVTSGGVTTYKWSLKTIRDISTLADLDDTTVSSPAAGQTLVYNATTKKWENGRQTTATISYW